MIAIRLERVEDGEAITHINEQAFDTAAEARLIGFLPARGKLVASLVAQVDDQVVGHIAFSPATLVAKPDLRGVGLGPMAVLPAMQRRGIGSALVNAGLDHCRAIRCDFAVVVGHPEYYPRFGFVRASLYSLHTSWDLPEGAFMVLELQPLALVGASGLAKYEPEFDEV